MKKALILCMAFFVLGSSFAVAQDRPTNWFIGAGAGMNIGFDGQVSHSLPVNLPISVPVRQPISMWANTSVR